MGVYDTVFVPCPDCGEVYPAQSKSGDCLLQDFELNEAPHDVMADVNRHAPFTCECGCVFEVKTYANYVPTKIKQELNVKEEK